MKPLKQQIQQQEQSEKPIQVYVCPNCQSTDVGYIFKLTNLFGVIPRMQCKKCNYEAAMFPQWIIDKKKLTELKSRPLKNKIKHKNKIRRRK